MAPTEQIHECLGLQASPIPQGAVAQNSYCNLYQWVEAIAVAAPGFINNNKNILQKYYVLRLFCTVLVR